MFIVIKYVDVYFELMFMYLFNDRVMFCSYVKLSKIIMKYIMFMFVICC